MSIRIKWIGLWLLFGFAMLSVFVISNHYLLKSTILHYVDQRDHQRLERLKTNLEIIFSQQQLASADEFDPFIWEPVIRLSHRVDLSQTDRPFEMILERFSRRAFRDNGSGRDGSERRFSFESKINLLDTNNQRVLGNAQEKYDLILPIKRDGKTIAQLGYVRSSNLTEQTDIEFAEVQEDVLRIGALCILALALFMLIPINRQLIQPIRNLVNGLKGLSSGHYEVRITQKGNDEWAQLAQHFNHLAYSLEEAKKSRSQWVADISHELRTPVTVLRSSVESMQEGMRPINESTLQNLHDEVLLLNRLIDDLYQLSLHDIGAMQYQMTEVDMVPLTQQAVQACQSLANEKGLKINVSMPSQPALILGDAKRLTQLVHNLLHNAIAYTDSVQANGQPGRIDLTLTRNATQIILQIDDSAPGVNPQDLPRLTDYLYRAENSRNRRLGGAGLGLSICQKIATSHQTELHFAASPLGGLQVSIGFALFNQTQVEN